MRHFNMINNTKINKNNIIGMLYRMRHSLIVKKYMKNKILILMLIIKSIKILFN
jgi:hypothetical protein